MLNLDSNSFANIESNISYINLQGNSVTHLPSNLFSNNCKFITLNSLNLATNSIQGSLPSLFKIQYLNLERNLFTGDIPHNFIDPSFTI